MARIMATMTTPQQIVVAINPSASFGKNKAVGARVVLKLRAAGYDAISLMESSYLDLKAASMAAVALKPFAFVVVGGDGMVNLGANVVATTGVPLGIVPAGTGNDMARALGIPHDDPDAAIDALIEALGRPPAEIDAGLIHHTDPATGTVGTTWFACMISAGIDAIINERANRLRRPRGASRYILALVIEIIRLKPIDYTLVLDGVEVKTQAVMLSIGNGLSLGGGMKVTPDAMLDDGLFDVLIVEPMSRVSFMRIFPRVFQGTHLTDPRVTVKRAAKISVASPGIAAYGDGERVGLLPIDVEVVPGALSVFAPDPLTAPDGLIGG
jgi:diacylglycerol kinase (ATP)